MPAKEDEVQSLQNAFKVTNIQKDDGGVTLRILTDAPGSAPTPSARLAAPCLEDYYLHFFGEAAGA